MKGWRTYVTLLSVIGMLASACQPYVMHDAAYQRGKSTELLKIIERADTASAANPTESEALYREVLQKTTIRSKFSEHQRTLANELDAVQANAAAANLSDAAGLGFSQSYAAATVASARAHLGLAKIYLAKNDLAQAMSEAELAQKVIKDCPFCPFTVSTTLAASESLFVTIEKAKGALGKALIHDLKVQLIADHLSSEAGTEEFYLEKQALFGTSSKKQIVAMDGLFAGVRKYQRQQQDAATMAVAGGLMAVNAGLQQSFAQQALAQSGGVMTPQVQQAQMNAQMAQMQSQLFMTMVAAQAGSNPKTLQVNTTPWAIPTFTQQLVDPKQGANTPTIMKGFATSAVQAGGASYHTGAQDVTQAVDALAPYRQSGKIDGAVAQVEKFAEVFNAFLTQVQEIKK